MRKLLTRFLFTLFGIVMVMGMVLRYIPGPPDAPNGPRWLSALILETQCSFVGLLLAVAVAVDPFFVIELRSQARRRDLREVTFRKRAFWFVLGFLVMLLGILLVLNSLRMCPALRC